MPRKSSPYTLDSRFAFVDIETTGSTHTHDRIIEVGILIVEQKKIIKKFTTLVNPETSYISPFITRLTGIRSSDLTHAPTFHAIHREVLEMLEGAIFVAHNARFDYGFIKAEFERHGVAFSAKTLCSVKLSRSFFPHYKKHNLDAVTERIGVNIKNRHRAYDDAEAIWKLFEYLEKNFELDRINSTIHELINGAAQPPNLKSKKIASLPEEPGVYRFIGKEGEVLYIGKSVNLKERVKSHFSSSLKSNKEMHIFNRVTDIETETTPGEFSALMREAHDIKLHQPIYNRALRHVRKLVIIEKEQSGEGYLQASIKQLNPDEIDRNRISNIMGVFRSTKQAEEYLLELASAHFLCRKLLGIEKNGSMKGTAGACFLTQLNKCKGACENKESAMQYNLRYLTAFEKTRIQRWPFSSSILIEEKNKNVITRGVNGSIFVVDHWCIIAQGSYEDDQLVLDPVSLVFDYDLYKILVRHVYYKKINFRQIKNEELEKILSR